MLVGWLISKERDGVSEQDAQGFMKHPVPWGGMGICAIVAADSPRTCAPALARHFTNKTETVLQ